MTSLGSLSDKQVDRLIKRIVLVLAIGIPLIAFLYVSDRHVAAGPTQSQREVAAAEAAVQKDPNDLGARVTLAAAYVTDKRFDDGIAQFTEILKVDPGNRAALLGRGIAYIEVAKVDAAAQKPDLQTAQLGLAAADFQAFIDGSKSGEFAATDPQLEQAYYNLGVVKLQQGQAADAVTALHAALAIDSGDADALYSYGMALIATGDAADAIAPLRRAVQFVPTGWSEPYQALSTAYTQTADANGIAYAGAMVAFCAGQLDQAKAALQPLTTGPMATDALLGLASISAEQGAIEAARGYYNQVLATDPTNASALIGLDQLGLGAGQTMPAASPTAGSN
ncbi:MAG: tetratricopeptide repeat protein [Candidatus Limnocylindrales bacterium]